MENIIVGKLTTALPELRSDPMGIQRLVYNLLEEASGGEFNIIDPSNPFSLLLEATAVINADLLNANNTSLRKLIPKLSTSYTELYGHISNEEAVGIFANPAKSTMMLYMAVEELKSVAVEAAEGGYSKITIPRETYYDVAGYRFLQEYPLELRVLSSGAIVAIRDTSDPSPLMDVDTNLLDIFYGELGGHTYLFLDVPVIQARRDHHYYTLTDNTGFKEIIEYPDKYHYVRAYHEVAGVWVEIDTVHSNTTYDVSRPTVTLEVHDSSVTVRVPPRYQYNGMIGSKIRIDVFTTSGDVDIAIDEYTGEAFEYRWVDITPEANGIYSSPLSSVTSLGISGKQKPSGGTNGKTFEELRELIVRGGLGNDALITDYQIENSVSQDGYTLNRIIDNLTNRTFLMTRNLPEPNLTNLTSPADTIVESIKVNETLLSGISTIKNHNRRWSILPTTIWRQMSSGAIVPISESERLHLESLEGDSLINYYPADYHYRNPFLIAVDENDYRTTYRQILVDQPKLDSRYFIEENTGQLMKTAINSVELIHTDTGYILTLAIQADGGFADLPVVNKCAAIAFLSPLTTTRSYLEGTHVGKTVNGEEIFEFKIATEWEFDIDGRLLTDAFASIINDTLLYPMNGTQVFDVIVYAKDTLSTEIERRPLSSVMNRDILGADTIGLSHETVTLELFTVLDSLHNLGRTIIGEPDYQIHDVDVPEVWLETVHERDENNHLVLVPNGNGGYDRVILHNVGDPVLDANGDQVFKYLAGSWVLDANGDRIPVSNNHINHYLDLVLMDARFTYITHPETKAYSVDVVNAIGEWSRNVTEDLRGELLNGVDLNVAPFSTKGEIVVSSVLGEEVTMDASVPVTVDLYVTDALFQDLDLRAIIKQSVTLSVSDALRQREISTEVISATMRAAVPDEVKAIDVQPINGLSSFTIVSGLKSCSLAKKLELQTDGTTSLINDLTVNFINFRR